MTAKKEIIKKQKQEVQLTDKEKNLIKDLLSPVTFEEILDDFTLGELFTW